MARVLSVLLGALCAMAAWRTDAAERPPNFIVIFVDDLGYGDLGCYGSPDIRTPQLDRMAAEGMRFTDFYVAAAVCSPSRAALLTGRYPIRTGINRVLFPVDKTGLPGEEVTVAELLKTRGYATACVGKWHLGHLPEFLPTRQGFDSYFGIPYSNDMDKNQPPLMRNEEIIEHPADQATLTRRYTEEAVGFIEAHQDTPFFLYLPHTFPHVPLFASESFRGKSPRGPYGDVVEELDWSTGQILDTVRRLGIAEQTLVLFTSDNGPWLIKGAEGGSAGPLRQGKSTTFEGGMRVPCIAWWPGTIAPGREERAPAMAIDLLPTLADLAGIALPEGRTIDGRSLAGVLRGTGTRGEERFYYFSGRELQAVREGDWKLKRAFNGRIYAEPLQHEALLVNLREDVGESNNLAGQYPERVQSLEASMRAFEQQFNDEGKEAKP
jgi:arylsulfatase A-like enzyme